MLAENVAGTSVQSAPLNCAMIGFEGVKSAAPFFNVIAVFPGFPVGVIDHNRCAVFEKFSMAPGKSFSLVTAFTSTAMGTLAVGETVIGS